MLVIFSVWGKDKNHGYDFFFQKKIGNRLNANFLCNQEKKALMT